MTGNVGRDNYTKIAITIVILLLVNPYALNAAEYHHPQDGLFIMPPPYVETPRELLKSSASCSCVTYARRVSGIDVGVIGMAKNHPVNSNSASVGAIGVTKESNYGHLFVVQAIEGDMIKITESNWIPCQVTTRTIPADADYIIGFYN